MLARAADPEQAYIHEVLPHKLAVDAQENLYIIDRENKRLQVFDKDLKKRNREIQLPHVTCGFYEDATGQLWLSTGRHGQVIAELHLVLLRRAHARSPWPAAAPASSSSRPR